MTGGMSLAQTGNQMRALVAAIGAVVDATVIDPAKIAKLKSFTDDELSLAQQEPAAEEEAAVAAPQAKVVNYESKSATILTLIDNMREEVVENLRKSRNADTADRHAYEMLSQSLDNEINVLSDRLAMAQSNKGAAEEALGQAEGDLKATSESLAADEEYLKNTQNSCHVKAEEWAARQTQAAEEMSALEEAKEILSSKVSVFVQVKSADDSSSTRQRVVSLLHNLGRKFNSFALLQAASSASADPFAKIRGMISDMLAKLETQAREEADHNEMCVSELAKNEKKKAKKAASLEKHNTRFDKATATIAKLADEIADLEMELKDLAASVAEATRIRNAEHAENVKVIAENKESAAAVAEAIKVLRQYYGSNGDESAESLVQFPAPTFSEARTGGATPIIGILETAESDFTKLFMETESSESEAAEAYKKMIQGAEVSKAKKEALIAGKKSEVETLKVSLGQTKEDIATTESEMDAVMKTLDALHKDCDSKAMSYVERKSRREAEIAGLQQALEVLSAEEEPSLVQRSFLARKP